NQLMIAQPVDIQKEYYVGAVIDRKNARPVLVVSQEGEREIEEIAEKSPDKILQVEISYSGNLRSFQLWKIAKFMGWKKEQAAQGMEIVAALAKAFIELDGSLLEINPLVEDKEGRLLALDAKF